MPLKNVHINSINIASLLLLLLPFFLLTGPFLSDLSLVIISLIFLYNTFSSKDYSYFQNSFFFIFISLYCFFIATSILSDHKIFSLESSIPYIRYGIFTLAVWFLLDKKPELLKYFLISLIFVICLSLIDTIFQKLFSETLFGIQSSNINRLSLPFSDKLILGRLVIHLLPLIIGLIFINISQNNKSFFYILLILIFSNIIVILSNEKSALIFLIFCNFFLLLFIFAKKIKFLLLGILSIALLVLIFSNQLKNQYDRTLNEMGMLENSANFSIYSTHYHTIYISAYNIFLDNPIKGIGPNNFRYVCKDPKYYINNNQKYDNCSTHPHNSYLQLLSETGIFPFLVITLLFFRILYQMIILKVKYKSNRYLNYHLCLLFYFFLVLFPLTPTMNFFNNWINILYYLPVGFYLHSFGYNYKYISR